MSVAFDTLGFARKLRERGVMADQAEAHAEAARDFIVAELFAKSDALAMEQRLKEAMSLLSLRITARMILLLAVAIALCGAILKLT